MMQLHAGMEAGLIHRGRRTGGRLRRRSRRRGAWLAFVWANAEFSDQADRMTVQAAARNVVRAIEFPPWNRFDPSPTSRPPRPTSRCGKRAFLE